MPAVAAAPSRRRPHGARRRSARRAGRSAHCSTGSRPGTSSEAIPTARGPSPRGAGGKAVSSTVSRNCCARPARQLHGRRRPRRQRRRLPPGQLRRTAARPPRPARRRRRCAGCTRSAAEGRATRSTGRAADGRAQIPSQAVSGSPSNALDARKRDRLWKRPEESNATASRRPASRSSSESRASTAGSTQASTAYERAAGVKITRSSCFSGSRRLRASSSSGLPVWRSRRNGASAVVRSNR